MPYLASCSRYLGRPLLLQPFCAQIGVTDQLNLVSLDRSFDIHACQRTQLFLALSGDSVRFGKVGGKDPRMTRQLE
ncbi:MAG: hypothetical protein ACREMT_10470, partial [Vulcanimicrobiaceae bacterium]